MKEFNDTEDEIKNILRYELATSDCLVKDNSDFQSVDPNATLSDLGLDSLDRINFANAIEATFDLRITANEEQNFLNLTWQELIDFIESKKGKKQ